MVVEDDEELSVTEAAEEDGEEEVSAYKERLLNACRNRDVRKRVREFMAKRTIRLAWLRGHDGGTETGVPGRESSVRHIQEHGEGDGRYGTREKPKSKTHVDGAHWKALTDYLREKHGDAATAMYTQQRQVCGGQGQSGGRGERQKAPITHLEVEVDPPPGSMSVAKPS